MNSIFWQSVTEKVLENPYFQWLMETAEFNLEQELEKALDEVIKERQKNIRKALCLALQRKPYTDFVKPYGQDFSNQVVLRLLENNPRIKEFFEERTLDFETILKNTIEERVEYFKSQNKPLEDTY